MIGTVDRRPGRPRDTRVDEAIVAATTAEVAEKGFAGATIDGIAARAGVGKATIYRRWKGKDELMRFAAEQLSDPCTAVDTGNLRDDLLAIFEPVATGVTSGEVFRLLPVMVAEAARDDDIRQLVRVMAAERRQPAVDAVARAKKRGEVSRSANANVVVDMIAGAIVYRVLV